MYEELTIERSHLHMFKSINKFNTSDEDKHIFDGKIS